MALLRSDIINKEFVEMVLRKAEVAGRMPMEAEQVLSEMKKELKQAVYESDVMREHR